MTESSTALRRAQSVFAVSVEALLLVGSVSISLLAGCTNSDKGEQSPEVSVDAPLLQPPKPGRGIQVTMATQLGAGVEAERCRFVRTGDEPLIVNHDEVRFTAGSHHVLLFTTMYDEIPTQDLHGETVDTSGVFDCSEGVQGIWSLTGLIAMSQSANGQSAVSLPEGVGVRVPAHALLLINAHYINTTDATLEPRVYINLHSIAEAELKQEGGLLFWYNPFLKAAANGRSQMRAGCPVATDIHITNAQSHMHRRGVGYVADVISSEGQPTNFYVSDAWENVAVEHYVPNLEVAAGSRIEWECDYENSGSLNIYQGPTTKHEMCMFIGSYYPRNDQLGFCMRNGAPFLDAEWKIGSGTASCAESFQCIVDASTKNSGAGPAGTGSASVALTTSITECLLASRADQSRPVSDMLGCLASAPSGANALGMCASEIAACQAL